MVKEFSFGKIMELNDREVEARRALFDPERIDRLAEHLYLAHEKAFNDLSLSQPPLPWEECAPAYRGVWTAIARAAVDSITGGMWGEKPKGTVVHK